MHHIFNHASRSHSALWVDSGAGAGADRQAQGSEIVWCIVVINDGC
jgi:hypothetical protein